MAGDRPTSIQLDGIYVFKRRNFTLGREIRNSALFLRFYKTGEFVHVGGSTVTEVSRYLAMDRPSYRKNVYWLEDQRVHFLSADPRQGPSFGTLFNDGMTLLVEYPDSRDVDVYCFVRVISLGSDYKDIRFTQVSELTKRAVAAAFDRILPRAAGTGWTWRRLRCVDGRLMCICRRDAGIAVREIEGPAEIRSRLVIHETDLELAIDMPHDQRERSVARTALEREARQLLADLEQFQAESDIRWSADRPKLKLEMGQDVMNRFEEDRSRS